MQEQFMCFNRGSVVAQLRTDRRGYCPGEAIALTGGLCNNMSKRTKPVKVILYQKTKYTQGLFAFFAFQLLFLCSFCVILILKMHNSFYCLFQAKK